MASRSRATISAKTENYQTKWLKNAMKSVGISTQEVLKEMSPNLYQAASSGAKAGRAFVTSMRRDKTTNAQIGNMLKSNKYVQYANKAYKNALEDIKTGNLNNTQRAEEAFMGSFEDDFSSDFSFGDDGGDTPVNVNYVNNNTEGFISLGEQMAAQSKANIKMQKASMDAYIAVSAAGMQQMNQLGSNILGQLNSINENLANIVQYNNDNMSRFIEASMAYYEKTGAKIAGDDYGSGSSRIGARDVLSGSKGGLNLSQYKAYVKQQLKDMKDNSTAGFIASMLDDQMLEYAAANPIGFLTKGAVQYMMPKVLKTSIESMEAAFTNFLPTVLSQVADWTEEAGNDYASKLKRLIGQTFGLKNERVKTLQGGATISRDAIPFDGETKHAITEIITKELRDQTGYLQIIAERFTHDKNVKNKVRANAEYWDWRSNSYITQNGIDRSIANEIVDSIQNAFNGTKFGESMQNLVYNQKTEKGQQEMERALREIYTEIERSNKSIGLNDLLQIIAASGTTKTSKKLISDYVKSMAANDSNSFNSLNSARLRSQGEANDAKRRILEDPTGYNLYASSILNAEDLDEAISKVLQHGGNANRNVVSSRGGVRRYGGLQAQSSGPDLSAFLDESAGTANKLIASLSSNMISSMNSLIHGGGLNAIVDGARDTIADHARIISQKITSTLFGDRNESGDSVGGLFSDTINSVKSRFDEIGVTIKDGLMEKLMGKVRTADGRYEDKGDGSKGILGYVTGTFKSGFDGWVDVFFGKDNDSDPDKTRKEAKDRIIKNVKDALPDTITGGIIGAGAGMLGGGLLGNLIGGPIGGAAIGSAIGFLRKNEKFQNLLFGEKDEDGKRLGGLINKKTQDFFKEHKGFLTGSATLGAIGGGLGLTGGGLLGSLVGGPVAGAVMGLAGGMVTKSSMFQRFLFGDEERGQKGFFKAISDAFNARTKADGEKFADSGKALGMSVVGAGVGGLTAALVSKMGIIGASLTPLGPVGGALIGLGAAIKAQSGGFRQWLFGEEDGLDINGKKAKKQGIVGQIGNMLNANLIRPMKTSLHAVFEETRQTVEHNILEPFSFMAEMVAGKAGQFVSRVEEKIGGAFNAMGDAIKEKFDAFLEPVTSAVGKTMTTLMEVGSKSFNKMISMPGNLMKLFIKTTGIKEKIDAAIHPFVELGRDIRSFVFSGMTKLFSTAFKGVGLLAKGVTYPLRFVGGLAVAGINSASNKLKDKLGDKYTELMSGDMMDSFRERFSRAGHNAKVDREKLRREVGELKRHDRNAKFIAKWTKNQYSEDTDEAREYLKMVRPDKYTELITGKSEGRGWKGGENTSKTQEAEQARIAKEGRGTAGMSESQLSAADPSTLSDEGRQTYFLQGIFNILRGNRWDGKAKDEEDKSNPTDGMTYSEKQKWQEQKKKETRERLKNDFIRRSTGKKYSKDSPEARKWLQENNPEAYQKLLNGNYTVSKNSDDSGRDDAGNGEGIRKYLQRKGSELHSFWFGNDIQSNALGRVGEHFKAQGSDMKNKLFRIGGDLSNLGSSLLSRLPHFADGGSTDTGMSIVGENGAEAILTKKGDTVISNNVLKAAAKGQGALKKAIEAGQTAKEQKEEKEKKEKKEREETIIDLLRQSKDATIEHKDNWSSIFGKKGLITAGAVLLFMWLKKNAPKIVDSLQNIVSGIANLAGDTINNIFNQGKFSSENDATTDGETAGQRFNQNIENFKNGDFILDENGEWTNQSESRMRLLTRTGLNIFNRNHIGLFDSKATKATKLAARGVEKVGKGVGRVGNAIFNTSAYDIAAIGAEKNAAGNLVKNSKVLISNEDFAKMAAEYGDEWVATARNTSYNVKSTTTLGSKIKGSKVGQMASKTASKAKGVVTSLGDEASKVGAKLADTKAGGMLKTVTSYVTKFFDDIAEKLAKKSGKKIGSKIFGKIPEKLLKVLSTSWDNIAAKVAATATAKGAGAAFTAGISEAIFATIGAINGVSGTAKLFHVDKDAVDGTMRTISGIIGALAGTTVGSILDIVFQLAYDVTGVDILNAIATAMYNALVGDDKEAKLADAQTAFQDAYLSYQDEEIKSQYETQKAAGIIDSNLSYEDFRAGVSDGTYKASYKSFADYNTEKHKSLGDKIGDGFSKMGSGIKSGWGKLFGTKNKVYSDSNGNTYTKNTDGTYTVTDSSGKKLGNISEDAIPSDATVSSNKTQGLISKGFSKVGSAISGVGSKIKDTLGKAKTTFQIGNSIIKDFITGKTEHIDLGVDKDDPSNSMIQGVELVTEKLLTVPRIATKTGIFIGKVIKGFVSSAGEIISGVKDGAISYINGESDDVAIEVDEENPLAGSVKMLTAITKFIGTPARHIVGIAKSIGGWISGVVSDVKDLGKSVSDSAKSYISGETDDITIDLAEDHPMHGMTSLLSGAVKFVTSPIRMIKSAFGTIKDVVSDMGNGLKDIGSAMVDAADTRESTLEDYWKSPVSNPDGLGDTIKNALFYVVRALNAPGFYMKQALEKVKDNVKEKFSWILDLAGIEKDEDGGEGGHGGHGGRGDVLNGHTYYSQNDSRWKNSPYNTGSDDATYGDSGCGPAAMAMVANDIGGRGAITPTSMGTLAKLTGNRDSTGTNWNFINDASNVMGISSHQALSPSASYIDSQLDSGNPVILSGTKGGYGKSPYTTSGHYVVAVGKDDRGNVIINDPRGRQYSGKYNLADVARETGSSWSFGGYGKKTKKGNNTFTANDVISVARSQIGYSEKASNSKLDDFNANAGSGNYTKYGILTGTNGQAWCASFVCWCFYTAANNDKSKAKDVLCGSLSAACRYNMDAFVKAKRFTKDSPEPGDVIFFTTDGSNTSNHTGIVVAVSKGKVTTVEGNTDPGKFNADGGCVAEKSYDRSNSRILGYGRPKYDGTSSFNGVSDSSSTTVDGASSSEPTSVWDKLTSGISSFFSDFSSRALSGNFSNTSYSFGQSSDSSLSSSSDDSSSSGAVSSVGSNTAEKTWNFLKSKGLNDYAIAGLMGNLHAESGINTKNLQNTYEKSLGYTDDGYTKAVDSGKYKNFGNDSAGYGLAQWTSNGRKQKLLTLAQKRNKSIGNVDVQLEHLWNELSGGYKNSVLKPIKNAKSLRAASDVVLHKFEAPADQSAAVEAKRAEYGQSYYNKYGGNGGGFGTGKKSRASINYTSGNSTQYYTSRRSYDNASRANNYIHTNKSSSMNALIMNAIEILADIATNTGSTSNKLDALKNLNKLGGNNTILYNNGNGSKSIVSSSGDIVGSSNNSPTRNDNIAYQIAKGGY